MSIRRGAFTLVELLLASTMTVLLGSATVLILRSTIHARHACDAQSQRLQDARSASRAITSALVNAVRLQGDQGKLAGMDDEQDGMSADRIRLFTIGRTPVRPNQPESDVKEVEFFLMRPEGEVPRLMKRIDPTWNEPPDGGGVVTPVADHVVELDFSYFDGTQWRPDWPERQGGWPTMVRVRLGVVLDDEDGRVYRISRLVNLPHGVAQASAESDSTKPVAR